jgi:hypothetical protein
MGLAYLVLIMSMWKYVLRSLFAMSAGFPDNLQLPLCA